MSTIDYYNHNAELFLASTQTVDMSDIYAHFIPNLAPDSAILDAGCGSGRDALNFKNMGFAVEAFDASEAMAANASELLGFEVPCCRFLEFKSPTKFAAIWACASLLHVSFTELPATFTHLKQFLAEDGVFVVSFKYGDSERVKDGRAFTDMNEARLAEVVGQVAGLAVRETWVTGDNRVGVDGRWLNAVLVTE